MREVKLTFRCVVDLPFAGASAVEDTGGVGGNGAGDGDGDGGALLIIGFELVESQYGIVGTVKCASDVI
jgi:hypothetical protein